MAYRFILLVDSQNSTEEVAYQGFWACAKYFAWTLGTDLWLGDNRDVKVISFMPLL
jgi:hypothetical protein